MTIKVKMSHFFKLQGFSKSPITSDEASRISKDATSTVTTTTSTSTAENRNPFEASAGEKVLREGAATLSVMTISKTALGVTAKRRH